MRPVWCQRRASRQGLVPGRSRGAAKAYPARRRKAGTRPQL